MLNRNSVNLMCMYTRVHLLIPQVNHAIIKLNSNISGNSILTSNVNKHIVMPADYLAAYYGFGKYVTVSIVWDGDIGSNR